MKSVWRVMDANFNRSREGLRVCEDLLRFVSNDRGAQARLKQMRHELSQLGASSQGVAKRLLRAREVRRDVGRKSLLLHQNRTNPKQLLAANFKRVEESLRTLEECAKLVAPACIKNFQALRFRVYELEKKALA